MRVSQKKVKLKVDVGGFTFVLPEPEASFPKPCVLLSFYHRQSHCEFHLISLSESTARFPGVIRG